jgi:hypothetical protein
LQREAYVASTSEDISLPMIVQRVLTGCCLALGRFWITCGWCGVGGGCPWDNKTAVTAATEALETHVPPAGVARFFLKVGDCDDCDDCSLSFLRFLRLKSWRNEETAWLSLRIDILQVFEFGGRGKYLDWYKPACEVLFRRTVYRSVLSVDLPD